MGSSPSPRTIYFMNKPIEVSASILAADFSNLQKDIKRCEDAGIARFHIDCMDGHFVPNMTIGPVIVEAMRKHTKLPLEAHLMIEHPGDYIESYAKAGADIIQIQVECYGQRKSSCRQWNQWPKEIEDVSLPALRADLQRIRSFGKKAFIVINPGTALCEGVLNDCDGVLVMSVNPGFAGQKFMPEALPKLARLKEIFKGDIAIDGGINAQTAPSAVTAGAHVLITASYLFGASNLADITKSLKSLT
jgi:ribulose-phosphate 3-epimerase